MKVQVQASRRVLALLMVVLLAVAGCSSESADEGDDNGGETPAATETTEPEETEEEATETEEQDQAESTATQDGEAEAEGTPAGDQASSERRIEPAEVMLVSGDGEQTGQVGPYFWTNEELELAAEVQGGYYERQDEPLEVAQGDELTVETPADDFPNEMTLEVYPPTEPNDNGLVQMESEPESTVELDAEDPVWEVDLEPGEHYLQLQTVWPTNEAWGRDREVTYRFWISVSE